MQGFHPIYLRKDKNKLSSHPNSSALSHYNEIYSALVKHDDDIRGLIAYSIYKREKHAWIKNFKEKYKMQPTDQEIEKFLVHYDERKIHELFAMADGALNNFAGEYTQKISDNLNEEYKRQLEILNQHYVPKKWIYRIWDEMLISFISLMILAFFVYFIASVLPFWQMTEDILFNTARTHAVQT